jgi:hypothetical protein
LRAREFAEAQGLDFRLLVGGLGLILAQQKFAPRSASLDDTDIRRLARKVADQLKLEPKPLKVTFFAHPLDGLGLKYLRAMVLACEASGAHLRLVDGDGAPYSDWFTLMERARIARNRVSKGDDVAQAFATLILPDSANDPMAYFARAEAHETKQEFAAALSDYREAERLFPLKKWREKAREAADRLARELTTGDRTARAGEREGERVARRIESDELRKCIIDAFAVEHSSPRATVLLCRSALVRILVHLEGGESRLQDDDRGIGCAIGRVAGHLDRNTADKMWLISKLRNRVEYKREALASDARQCLAALQSILGAVFPGR